MINLLISIIEGLLISRFTWNTAINKKKSISFLLVYIIFQCTFSYLAYFFNFSSFISTIIIISSVMLYNYNKTINSLTNSLFLGFTLNILILIANSSTLVFDYFINFTFNIHIPFQILLIISKIILWIISELVSRFIKHNSHYNNSKINIFNLAILLLTILYASIFDGYFKQLINTQYFLTNVIVLSFLVAVICKLFENQKEFLEQQANQELLKKELDFQKTNIKNILKSENETRKMRHNSKHTLLLLKEYANKKDLSNINKVLNEQINNISNLNQTIHTGNDSINFILFHYLPLIKEKNIELICNYFEIEPSISKLDFYIIFGNILENAIEHCNSKKIKKIVIELGETSNNEYYFKIQNTIDPTIKIDLSSSSKHSINHGYGITSITQLVKNNNGIIDFIQQKNNFNVVVILPL